MLSPQNVKAPCGATNKNCNKRDTNSKNDNKRSDNDAVHISAALAFFIDLFSSKFLGALDLVKGLCIFTYFASYSYNQTLNCM